MNLGQEAPKPKPVLMNKLKSRLLQPALTSHFQCWFNPPPKVRDLLNTNRAYVDSELLSLSCSDASLPGSTLYTHDVNNVYTGVNERFAYARAYDDRASFDFYVDNEYYTLRVFEAWLRYCVDDQFATRPTRPGLESPYFHSRVNFPDGDNGYRTQIYIDKFERDTGSQMPSDKRKPGYLRYKFIGAYPIEINSIPVSYEQSNLLKCTVSFTYTRFVLEPGYTSTNPATLAQTPYSTNNPSTDIFEQTSTLNGGDYFNNISPNFQNQQFDIKNPPTPQTQLLF
jgi:hypothetical protein